MDKIIEDIISAIRGRKKVNTDLEEIHRQIYDDLGLGTEKADNLRWYQQAQARKMEDEHIVNIIEKITGKAKDES